MYFLNSLIYTGIHSKPTGWYDYTAESWFTISELKVFPTFYLHFFSGSSQNSIQIMCNFFDLMFLSFRFFPRLRHKKAPTQFWSLKFGLVLTTFGTEFTPRIYITNVKQCQNWLWTIAAVHYWSWIVMTTQMKMRSLEWKTGGGLFHTQ